MKNMNFGKRTLVVFIAIILSSGAFIFIPQVNSDPNDPWLKPEWNYRKELIIDSSLVVDNLVNFPVLINLNEDTNLAAHAQDDGDDIVFIHNATGTKLNHEIELFDGSTGQLVAWVNVTSLSATTDTVLYMYYGNALCSTQENVPGTWKTGYAGVWHMEDTTTSAISDSTINDNDGVKSAANQPSETLTKIGEGQSFDGVDDSISAADDATLRPGSGDFTVSAWAYIKTESTATEEGIVAKYPIGAGRTPMFTLEQMNKYTRFRIRDANGNNAYVTSNEYDQTGQFKLNQWVYYVGTRTGNTVQFWVNGILQGTSTNNDIGNIDNNDPVNIGRFWTSASVDGSIDEVRLSIGTARSQTWIQTEYQNQHNPSGFYNMLFEETLPG